MSYSQGYLIPGAEEAANIAEGGSMQAARNFLEKFSIARELIQFFWQRKLWWMIPMVTILLIIGMLIVFTQGSAIAPFIYTLF